MGKRSSSSSSRRGRGATLNPFAVFAIVGVVVVWSPSLWKLARVSWLLPCADIGKDLYYPADGAEVIPPIFHHFTKHATIPEEWDLSYQSTKGVHKKYVSGKVKQETYEHMLWTDEKVEKFMKKEAPDFFETTYEKYPYKIEQVDAARYFVLWYYGGVYIDMDVGMRRSLDNLRRLDGEHTPSKTSLILPLTKPLGVSNDFMMASPRHPFFAFVTQRLISRSHESWFYLSPFFRVLWTTGPLFLSVAFFDYLSGTASPSELSEAAFLCNEDYTRRLLFHVPGSSWLKWDGWTLLVLWYWVLPAAAWVLPLLVVAALLVVYVARIVERRQRASLAEGDNPLSSVATRRHR
jgi:mannosyltransferase OCH1-like enzyme